MASQWAFNRKGMSAGAKDLGNLSKKKYNPTEDWDKQLKKEQLEREEQLKKQRLEREKRLKDLEIQKQAELDQIAKFMGIHQPLWETKTLFETDEIISWSPKKIVHNKCDSLVLTVLINLLIDETLFFKTFPLVQNTDEIVFFNSNEFLSIEAKCPKFVGYGHKVEIKPNWQSFYLKNFWTRILKKKENLVPNLVPNLLVSQNNDLCQEYTRPNLKNDNCNSCLLERVQIVLKTILPNFKKENLEGYSIESEANINALKAALSSKFSIPGKGNSHLGIFFANDKIFDTNPELGILNSQFLAISGYDSVKEQVHFINCFGEQKLLNKANASSSLKLQINNNWLIGTIVLFYQIDNKIDNKIDNTIDNTIKKPISIESNFCLAQNQGKKLIKDCEQTFSIPGRQDRQKRATPSFFVPKNKDKYVFYIVPSKQEGNTNYLLELVNSNPDTTCSIKVLKNNGVVCDLEFSKINVVPLLNLKALDTISLDMEIVQKKSIVNCESTLHFKLWEIKNNSS